MGKSIRATLHIGMLLFGLANAGMAQTNDVKGSQDPALFTRMPNFRIYEFRDSPFDVYNFKAGQSGPDANLRVEGHLTYWKYFFDPSSGAASPSRLQILRNYQAAAAKVGGKVVYEDVSQTTLKISRDPKVIWVEVRPVPTGKEYTLRILEQQAMAQDVVADADKLKASLTESGHVEVPGILFDFGKSEIKPESEGALKEIAKLLQASGGLKVWVVGHTDYVGSAESNLTLSSARAASVVKYLTSTLGIDPKRLSSFGAGPYAPVSPNHTEEGRAKNRRVELVAQP
jgi:OOP family OmpA-OmpF porin